MVVEYFFKVREMKREELNCGLEFYVGDKRYIADSIQEGKVEESIVREIKGLSRALIQKNPRLPIWIQVERQ